jgi:hypothetical protein
MPEVDWTYERRRIPITTGWGPCKRTNWVPVNEYYTDSDGRRRRTFFRAVGLDPEAARYGPLRELNSDERPNRDLVRIDDPPAGQYAGFRERPEANHGPYWRYHAVGQGLAEVQAGGQPPILVPEPGWNGVWPWQPPIPWDALDPVIAEALQRDEEREAQRARDDINRRNAEIGEIEARIHGHVNDLLENERQNDNNNNDGGGGLRGGADEARLRGLQRELAQLDERQRNRDEEERRAARRHRRDRDDIIRDELDWEDRERARRRRRRHRRW